MCVIVEMYKMMQCRIQMFTCSKSRSRSNRKTRSQDLNKSKSLGFPLTLEKGGKWNYFWKGFLLRQPLSDTSHKKLSQNATTDCYTTHQSKVSCISDTFITKFGARYRVLDCIASRHKFNRMNSIKKGKKFQFLASFAGKMASDWLTGCPHAH